VGVSDGDGFHAATPNLTLTALSRLLIAEPTHAFRDVVKRVRELGRAKR